MPLLGFITVDQNTYLQQSRKDTFKLELHGKPFLVCYTYIVSKTSLNKVSPTPPLFMLTAGCVGGDHGASVIILGGLYQGPAHQLNIPGQLFRVIPINPHYHYPILLHLGPDNLVHGIFSEQSFYLLTIRSHSDAA